jgi:Carboxypeptidase regulatory-like domain
MIFPTMYKIFLMNRTSAFYWALLPLITLLTAFPFHRVMAQETRGELRGLVSDTLTAPLPGATVTLIHLPSGTRYRTATSADGRYDLTGLRVGGPYRIEISYTGKTTITRDDLQVSLGEAQSIDFTLHDESLQLQSAVVTGIQRPRANAYGAGTNLSTAQIRQMPSISRSITDVTRLVPQGTKDNSFAGSDFRYNNVTIDGAINNDAIGFSPSTGGIIGTSNMPGSSTRNNPISMDAIQDMQVYIAPYDVKIGNFTGGSINAVTRSGTNTVEGSIYVTGRNATITGADRAGDGSKMPSAFHDVQMGARLGFPIIKDKLFFFTNEEYTDRVDPVLLQAGSPDNGGVLSAGDAQNIRSSILSRYGFDPGTYGQFNTYSNSVKFFNRIDWNINANNQLAVRNNTVQSEALSMERDQQDFRFGGISYVQTNNQSSTVAELTTRFTNRWSNSAIVGFTSIHDYRTPQSDPAIPQVEIVGRTPGSTIFLGTDREGSVFNMKQQTIEVTDNVSIDLGNHHLTVGTHNELYHINYGFVNAWNGRVTYPSIEDFLNNNPERARGSYNYINNDRSYILSHPAAVFNINFYSVYIQDEIRLNDRFKITPGFRADYTDVPQKQPLSDRVASAVGDPFFATTYTYTPLNQISNKYLGRVQASPRVGFSYDILGNKRLILRGGSGLFTGRIPLAWLGYAFYNTGKTYGAYDQNTSAGTSQFAPGTDPLKYTSQGIANFAAQNGVAVNNPNAGKTEADLVDNHFVMPQVSRSSLAVDFIDKAGWHYTLEGIYTQVITDVKFQNINVSDNPTYMAYDTAAGQRKQPIFPSGSVNPAFTNVYELSNTGDGRRYSITGQVSRRFPTGLDVMAAYTYGRSWDINNGIRNSMESSWQLNQALNPNSPGLATSNFEVRHRIIADLGYRLGWQNGWTSSFSLFGSFQSGAPYTFGFVNATPQNSGQAVSLAYIPHASEAINFFQDYTTPGGEHQSAAAQAAAFNAFIDANKYLSSRRGLFTQRNGTTTPWNNQVDFRFAQDFDLSPRNADHHHVLTFTVNILNLTNLLDKKWGWVYFAPATYNYTESIGLVPFIPSRTALGYPQYTFQNPGRPYSVDFMQSRWQMDFGLRYSF